MKAIIRPDVPDWQIGQEVTAYFPDTMQKSGVCEEETVEHALEILRANGWKAEEPVCAHCKAVHVVLCKDCNNRGTSDCPIEELCNGWIPLDDWFCADGERKCEDEEGDDADDVSEL